MDEQNEDHCIICGKPGTLFECDSCPRSFHQGCLLSQPPSLNPEEKWSCCFCSEDDAPARDEIDWQYSYEKLKSLPLLPEDMKQVRDICTLREIVRFLMRYHFGEVFSVPVDLRKYPDYKNCVTRPMDLGMVLSQIDDGVYFRNEEDPDILIIKDISLIWENCFSYNREGSLTYRQAREQKKRFTSLMQRYLGDRNSKHQKQIVRCFISGNFQSISRPECCVTHCKQKDLIPLPPCQCTTTLFNPSSVKYPVETADLNKILEHLELKSYNFRLMCKTCGNKINELAKDAICRICPICRKKFQPRAFEKCLKHVDNVETRESISLTIKILDRIKEKSPINYNPNQKSDGAELSLFPDLTGKVLDEELSLVISMDGDIDDLSDIDDVFATDNLQNADTDRKNSILLGKEQFLKELSDDMRLRQKLLPSIVQNENCHICHLRRPKLIAFGCGEKHLFCEKHATSRLGKQHFTLEAIVSSLTHCPICCFECKCSKCERDRDSKWRGRSKTRASPKLIGDNDQETVKDSKTSSEENKAVMMPKQCLVNDKKKAEITKGYEIIDLSSIDDELKSESYLTRAANHNNRAEDLDERFSTMHASKKVLFSEVGKLHDELEGVKKQREELSVKIRESTERCNSSRAQRDAYHDKLKDSKFSSGSYYISDGSRPLHRFPEYPHYLTMILEKHDNEYKDELEILEALKKEEGILETRVKALGLRCNQWKNRLHSFTVECVQWCSTWSMETQPLCTTSMNRSHTLLKAPQTVAHAMSTEDDNSSLQSMTTQPSVTTIIKKRRMQSSSPTLNDTQTAAPAVSNSKVDDVSVIVID
jgi:hypothetical protein